MNHEGEQQLEAKGLWFVPERVFAAWEFKGSPSNPDVTAEQAMNHVREFMTSGDNEYISSSDLETLGFVRKAESPE